MTETKEEEWKEVVGYNGDYEVSNMGRVYSNKYKNGRMMKQTINSCGYLQVHLYCNSIKKSKRVHRIVSEAFIGSICGMQIDHIDSVKTNNKVSNLRIVTHRENAHFHVSDNGKKEIGVTSGRDGFFRASISYRNRKYQMVSSRSESLCKEIYSNALAACENDCFYDFLSEFKNFRASEAFAIKENEMGGYRKKRGMKRKDRIYVNRDKIRDYAKEKGLKMYEVAMLSGVPLPTFEKYNRNGWTTERITMLLNAVDMDLEEITASLKKEMGTI